MIEKKTLEREIIKIIEDEEIFNIIDIFSFYTRISRATFYNRELDKLDSIKKALDDNKVKTKQKMLLKWIESESAPLQISAFKLLGTEDERMKLSQSYNEIKLGGKKGNPVELSIKDIEKIIDNL